MTARNTTIIHLVPIKHKLKQAINNLGLQHLNDTKEDLVTILDMINELIYELEKDEGSKHE